MSAASGNRKVAQATAEAAKAFAVAVAEDFDGADWLDAVVAGWHGSSGVLLVAARGEKAELLDRLLRENDLAQPDGRRP